MRVHFLGIGGSGASAAAALAQAEGFEVTGCDLEPQNEFTTQFKPSQLLKGHNPMHLHSHPEPRNKVRSRLDSGSINKIPLSKRHALQRVRNDKLIDILAVTPAIFSLDPNNPELVKAKKQGIPILTWQQFLGEYLTKDKFVIAICGTHGKTTTTAMIAQILEDAKLNPTVLLGAIHPKWAANYRIGSMRHSKPAESETRLRRLDSESIEKIPLSGGHALQQVRHDRRKYFVIEADEFNDNFLHFKPDINVVTNIEMDHPEYFKDLEAVKESFKKFLLQTKGTIVANLSDSNTAEVLKIVMKIPSSHKYHDREVMTQFLDYSKNQLDINLRIPGQFNRLNAMAALQVGLLLGVDPQIIRNSLSNYCGVGRRFEYLGDFNPSTGSGQVRAKVYSDFGHHPTEIKKTMEAARQKFPNQKIWLIYEPHMFSRTLSLFNDFVKVFREIPVDKIIVTDIYPSREVDTGIVSSQQLAKVVGYDSLVYHTKKNLKEYLKNQIKNGDLMFFMGAGDIDKIAREFVTNEN